MRSRLDFVSKRAARPDDHWSIHRSPPEVGRRSQLVDRRESKPTTRDPLTLSPTTYDLRPTIYDLRSTIYDLRPTTYDLNDILAPPRALPRQSGTDCAPRSRARIESAVRSAR